MWTIQGVMILPDNSVTILDSGLVFPDSDAAVAFMDSDECETLSAVWTMDSESIPGAFIDDIRAVIIG